MDNTIEDADPPQPAPSQMDDFNALATDLANAAGQNVLVGVRPGDRGWFACCGSHEIDAPSPPCALSGLVGHMARRVDEEVRSKDGELQHLATLNTALQALNGTLGGEGSDDGR